MQNSAPFKYLQAALFRYMQSSALLQNMLSSVLLEYTQSCAFLKTMQSSAAHQVHRELRSVQMIADAHHLRQSVRQ